ncbi:hypothetical protein GW756_03225 [bacterium]|nr:hypothetical protein [bacterium]NCQ55471.1 hypothetical protein [Candidatus Parcubacteria bacterium]NCS67833.1 hypothetical protein [Candidatus Peregrinibacteria bacterium]NCS96353.1 hypothetical protein [bacterium]
MKIQSEGGSSLRLSNKKNQIIFNPLSTPSGEVDIIALSEPKTTTELNSKKLFNLPGEFEVSGILAQGFFTDDQTNVAYKVVVEEVAVVHFGNLKEVPTSDFFEKLGENVDVIVLALNENFDDKKAKILMDKLDPRMVILIGDSTYFAAMTAKTGAKMAEEEALTLTKSGLSDDKTDVIILNV